MPPYTVNDLPRFSPWPARLLGLDTWSPKKKTRDEVLREYEKEKWGTLLKRVRNASRRVTLAQINRWMAKGAKPTLCSFEDRLKLLTPEQSHKQYLAVVEQALKPYRDASALVELGAGYGNIILALLKSPAFAAWPAYAGEFTSSGRKLLSYLARSEGVAVTVGHSDLGAHRVAEFAVPDNALVFTSMAVPYVVRLAPQFVRRVSAWRPRAVVHVEPCFEHFDTRNLLGALRARYVQVNGYNMNLVSVLYTQVRAGRISILEEKPAVFGRNPLLPVSIIAWAPSSIGKCSAGPASEL